MNTASLLALALSQSNASLSPDLRQVTNVRDFSRHISLSPEHRAALRKNGFFVSPSDRQQLYYVYGANDYANLPSLVTVDNVLQLYHVVFDATLRTVETQKLLPELRKLTDLMIRQSALKKPSGLEQAAKHNLAFFGVVDRLLGGRANLPADVANLVERELALIEAHAGFTTSAIFPYKLDYSQFIVRGHYTKSPALQSYFRAMMWLGLVPMAFEARSNRTVTPLPDQIRMAVLMTDDLVKSGAMPRWQKIYDVSSLFAGRANDLTPVQIRSVTLKTLGEKPDLARLSKQAVLAAFVAEINNLPAPKIVVKKDDATVAGDRQFRFMGQRAIPDSVVFNRLTDADYRSFPNPLDVAAALGSRRAAALLDAQPFLYNPKGWPKYRPEREKIAAEMASWPSSAWRENLYAGWLDTVRTLFHTAPGAPPFMRTSAWQDKTLSTALASWTELRHDTILYGLQTVAEMGDGEEEQPFVPGYVEPAIGTYVRLRELLRQTKDELGKAGFLPDKLKAQISAFDEILRFFVSVSRRELGHGKLTKAEHQRIRHIEGFLEEINTETLLMGQNFQQLSESDLDMALVADVHTALDKALTVAVGHGDDLIAIVPIEGKRYLARGSVFSYYEFKVPISERMTDEAWKKLLQTNRKPSRPSWINSYFVPKPAPGKGE